MSKPHRDGDIAVGNIANSQGVAIGHGASAVVHGSNASGAATVNAAALRAALEQLFDALGEAQLPRDKTRGAQTAAGKAIEGAEGEQVDEKTIVDNLKHVGETLQQANIVVEQGSTLWASIGKVAATLGPLVGGAAIVLKWFGLPLP